MKNFKTIEVIQKYSESLKGLRQGWESDEERFLCEHPEIYLAESMIQDFDKHTLRKLSRVLEAATMDDDELLQFYHS